MRMKIVSCKNTVSATLLLVIINAFVRTSGIKFNASQAFDDTWPTESDLENELEQKRARNGAWSTWSEWSTCSRSCDGGIAQQLRRCHSPNGCKGDSIRYKICNMQPCPDQKDFRAHQCAAYDDVPYDGTLFKWTPHYDYVEPCALTCRGRPAHLPDDDTTVESEGDSEHYDEPSVVVQLSSRVQDGTRCRSGSLDMCIQGKCQRVGCDLKIGSAKKVDVCGVCGGDGSSCSQPLYHWEMAPMSLCSVTCGTGYKMSRPTCKNRVTGADVEESLCSASTRPEPSVVQCNTHLCPSRWIADEWAPCSRPCGGGMRERTVACTEEKHGIKVRIPDVMCRTPKPPSTEACNIHECPKWKPTEWSGCSVSCGSGIQIRGVECINADGTLSTQCDSHSRPPAAKHCFTGIPCYQNEPLFKEHGPDNFSRIEDDDEFQQGSYNDQPFYSHQLEQVTHHEELPPKYEHLVGGEKAPTEPTFIKDSEWSPCSVTCGEGIRQRIYRCKIFLEYSRTIATVNDSLCEEPKPPDEIEHCVVEPCSLAFAGYDEIYPRDSIKVGVSEPGKTYIWREQGYTSCSASCLGGVEELIINCVREDNGKVVSPFLCSPETKPEARVRTCNDRPCPPRWNYSDYTPCSKSCGIGIKTREVTCIHEVTRGGENTMVVPNNMCPQPPPADRQYCNVLDCPVRWEVSEWSKCSQSCGFGIKERRVECKQIMAQEHKIERPESMCPSAKPPDKKPCNVKPCPPEDPRPTIIISNSTYIQHDPKKIKITLKIGGAAEVFFGTQVKIKCPVKRYNRTKIRWSKDHKILTKSKKFKISKKGALRIIDITFRDAGTYTCHAGLSTAEINIEVKPKPGGVQTDDYDKRRDESERLARDRSGTEFLTSSDVYSTGKGSSNNNKKKQRERLSDQTNKQQKSDGMQRAYSSIMDDESQLIQPSPADDIPQKTAKNSGSRAITIPSLPYFLVLLTNLQLLWPFHTFSNIRNNPILLEKGLHLGIDLEHFERDEPIIHKNHIITNNNLAIGKEHIKFEWKTTPWSECLPKCEAANGIKNRNVYCTVKIQNLTQQVENGLCEDAGLKIPNTFDVCENEHCPKWQIGNWSLCHQSRCFSRNTALQRRSVICTFSNKTITDNCDKNTRPSERQECYNEICKGVWRFEPWSECNAPCGKQGIKYRILQCVWYGTKRSAGNACRNMPRPAVMKICKGSPCLSNTIQCKDTSYYCRNVRSMGFCRLHRYRQKCCKSCRFNMND